MQSRSKDAEGVQRRCCGADVQKCRGAKVQKCIVQIRRGAEVQVRSYMEMLRCIGVA